MFYPDKLPQRRELAFVSNMFNTIELNGSFYSLQRPSSYRQWYAETPDDFVFAVKGSRYITHMRRLIDVEVPLANFFAQGVLLLAEKLGPILWQLPPNFQFDKGRLERFFQLLPRTHEDAGVLARRHEVRLKDRSWYDVKLKRKLRHAIEVRHESFVCEDFIALLRQYHIGLVVADTVEWPLLLDVTADFVYCRLHGSEQLYASGYNDPELDIWADRVARWAAGGEVEDGRKASKRNGPKRSSREVFFYFDNDAKVRAPFDAKQLQAKVLSLL